MKQVCVNWPHGTLRMSIAEAEQLQGDLATAVRNARMAASNGLQPPRVTDGGYLTKAALFEFFAQVWEAKPALGNHAGKLFAAIVRSATGPLIDEDKYTIVVVHDACGRSTLEPECSEKSYYRSWKHHADRERESYRINAASLKKGAEDFLGSGYRNVGPCMAEDLRLLIEYL